jgi:integrase
MKPVIRKEATTALILDTRRKKAKDLYPVKLRVTYRRIQKYYSLKKSYTLNEWAKIMQERPDKKHNEIKVELIDKEKQAKDIIKALPVFSFGEFERKYIERKTKANDVFGYYQNKIDKLTQEGRISTAEAYSSSMRSLKDYYKNRTTLVFQDITVKFLEGYEKFHLSPPPITDDNNGKTKKKKAKSLNTLSIYLRALRAICREAIKEGHYYNELYPFGDGKYEIPSQEGVKKALTQDEISKIWHYKTIEGSPEKKAQDFFMFSFLANGINMQDIAKLTYENLKGDVLSFIRTKTKTKRKRNLSVITAILRPEAQAIIKRWGNKKISDETLIFPILSPGLDPQKEKALVKQFTKTTNKYLDRIGKACEIDKKISTYTARHSFATVLKRSNAPISFISEALGHSSQKTTQTYLDSFDEGAKRQWSEQLSKILHS